ncbi:hypothetical protein FN846DRAFT_499967 [Sphaerosporella brunnea]|uniref:ZSWIM1/3 RNaseH-like domain-containing protein n=1 Tax=Sphaerosporella brunnea TaxID=1250544 RepID=A0A5J5EF78_9PEZI|nr:hypothetical protein FN846DRAFT_499967 [Sphaerosporella brunnea]
MITVPEQADYYKEILFNLENPVVLSVEQFDTYWPLTDAVWTKIGGKTLQQNSTVEVQHYECRLRKSKKTGTNVAEKEGRVVKNRITTSRVKDLCQVRMKMTRTLTEPITVTLERKDGSKHTHDLEETFRLCGLPSAVKRVVQAEADKDYTAAQIFHALKGGGKIEGSIALEAIGGASLKRHDVSNAKRGSRPDQRTLLHGISFRQDVDEARSLRNSKGRLSAEFEVLDAKKEQRWGLVFAEPKRLQVLQQRGYLTQFDSTHKMNKWKHNMFSFLVRDGNGIFIPAAHCVVDRENSETLSRAMEFIKSWCCWTPRYVLTDDSSIEQLAVKKTVHSMRTLQRKFFSAACKRVFDLLRQAMFTFTGIKCEELCRQAVNAAPEAMRSYVETHWLETQAKWAMYA